MGEVSSFGEVIELAITREIQAAEFYMELAGRATNRAMRTLFETLGEEELGHKARLELEMMKEGLVVKTVGRLFEVEVPDYAAEAEIGPDMEYKDALALAIRKERGAFRLYAELAGMVAEERAREVLLELAEEEVRHLMQVEREYDRLIGKRE